MVLPWLPLDQALAGGPLLVHGDGQQVRCFGHVDVVGGILDLMALPQAAGKVYNFGNDEPTTIQGLAERVIAQVDQGLKIRHVPYTEVFGPGFEDLAVASRI